MSNKKAKILILVEGAKTDLRLMKKVLDFYSISDRHQIISYNTSIYDLYQKMFYENDPDSLDLLQVLKEHEKDETKKSLFDEHYSDIILIFDLDPQSPDYAPEVITKMADYFTESSDTGKLYLNFPMVESFYHMKSIPDPDFMNYTISMEELVNRTYKTRVKQTCRIPYKNFATTKEACDLIISQNLEKAKMILRHPRNSLPTDTRMLLAAQLSFLQSHSMLYILCTCIFYIVDYNPLLIQPKSETPVPLQSEE